jgi:hypothetical protein
MAALALFASIGSGSARERDEVRELREALRRLQQQVEELQRRATTPSEEERKLRGEVQRLQEEVESLHARAMPVEPAEEIKRVTEWICERGHVFSTEPAGGRCPYDGTRVVSRAEYRKVKLARRQSLSEMLEARLDEEARRRVALGVSALGIVQATAGGVPQRVRGVGTVNVFLTARPAFKTLFFADLEAIGGDGPDAFTGSASGLNAAAGSLQDTDHVDRVSLREAWLTADAFESRLMGVAGKLDLTNYFDRNAVANDETSQFVSAMFVNNPLLGNPVQGVGHLANAPAAHLAWDTFREWRFGLGAQAPRNSGGALGRTPFIIGELTRSTQLLGGPGNYRLWLRRNGSADRSVATGVSLDQAVGPWARTFARFAYQTGGRERDRQAWSLGIGLHSLLSSRPRDETGIAYGWMRAENGRVEDLAEAYHRFYLTDHLSAGPLAQYAFHLAGNERVRPRTGVFVGGARVQVNF